MEGGAEGIRVRGHFGNDNEHCYRHHWARCLIALARNSLVIDVNMQSLQKDWTETGWEEVGREHWSRTWTGEGGARVKRKCFGIFIVPLASVTSVQSEANFNIFRYRKSLLEQRLCALS